MFEATIQNIQLLRDSIDTISQIIDEGVFRLKKEGIELIAADRAMVAVVDFKLLSSAFEKYDCGTETSIGLNLANFLTILRRAGNDKVTLKLNEKENKLEVIIQGDSVRSLSIPIIDISSEDVPPISQLNFSASAEMKASVMEEGIFDADIVADSVIIESNDSMLKFRAEGDSSKAELKMEKNSHALLSIDSKDAVRARYPLDYLKKFVKAIRLVDNAKLYFGNDFPMKLELKGENIYLSMVLAPRVSEQ